MLAVSILINTKFLSTLSLRRATRCQASDISVKRISIHALLAESDLTSEVSERVPPAISIHALLAESDTKLIINVRKVIDFYPRSPCGERPRSPSLLSLASSISIHALLAESDALSLPFGAVWIISIHALLAESDDWPPVRDIIQWISIHALLAESDGFGSAVLILIL